MPIQHCPRCQRANPPQAVHCYFDGIVLRQPTGNGPVTVGLLPREFVFPSQRRCRTLDDFVQGCHYEWDDARELLRRGEFTRYFSAVGRIDLARAAREAETQSDPDIGLHNFLRNLPAQVSVPKLDLRPRRLVVGPLRAGQAHECTLTVLNVGKGILQGKVAVVEGGKWLSIEGSTDCPIKAPRDQPVTLRIDTRGLPSRQSFNGRLMIATNGGLAEVPVRLDLTQVPFAADPFKGARDQRDLAERMRKNPKAAVPLLESGEVQRWFAVNGWTYPAAGAPAKGIAAVQQFFEGLGLSKPPPVQLSEREVQCQCVAPEVVRRQVVLQTPAKKWVYAQIDSDVPWLRVTTPNVSGPQQAAIGYEIDTSLMDGGKLHEGRLNVLTNANQRLALRVLVDVRLPARARTGPLLGPLFTVALLMLLYRGLLLIPSDLFARVLAAPGSPPPEEVADPPLPGTPQYAERWLPPGSPESWSRPAVQENGYLRRLLLATWWIGTIAGAVLVWRRRSTVSDALTGALAGTMAGFAGAVTVGCLCTLLDTVPRWLVAAMSGGSGPAAAWTLLWIGLVLIWWMLLGAGIGALLNAFGTRGRRLLQYLGAPMAGLLTLLGVKRAAATFAF